MWPRVRTVTFVLAAASAIAVVAAETFDISTDLSAADKEFASLMLREAGYEPSNLKKGAGTDFEAEVRSIAAVQDAVLKAAPESRAIAFAREREPKDLYELKYGLCHDRSRAIEKSLTWLGFRTRHVSVYSTRDASWYWALLTPHSDSHAVTEVLTSKGWMVVDSTRRWLGLEQNRRPVSLAQMQDGGIHAWAPESRDRIHRIFTDSFVHIRGLYSRHGYFYPPYGPVPDYDLEQIVENFHG
jgi:hypothetical protein